MKPTALLSYASGTSDVPLLGETIGRNLGRVVARFGERDALVECATGRRYSYRELDREVGRVARGLLALGVAKGDRVGIWAPNCCEWVLVQYATARIGAILVTVNPAYQRRELEYVLRQSGTKVLFSAIAHKTTIYRAIIEETRALLRIGACRIPRRLGVGRARRARRRGPPRRGRQARRVELSFDDPINIQYTSGTTGLPEGGHALASQHPEQRVLRRASSSATRRPTASASRSPSTTASAWSWATSARRATARASSSRPLRSTPAPRSHAVDGSGVPRSTGCPRCSSRSSRARLRRWTCVAPDGDHGRLAVPRRGDEARGRPRCTWTRWPSVTA